MKADCVHWGDSVDPDGYGLVTDPVTKRRMRAHRWVWERKRGPIPSGLFVLHRCDYPRCVNIDHLFLGTHADNMADMAAKGRRSGERNPAVKLNRETVEKMRARSAEGISNYQIGREFGIGRSQAWNIINYKSWR